MRIDRRAVIVVGLMSIGLILGLANLDRMPPLWWDEGWTLTVARTWVERGEYGRLLNGAATSPYLAASYVVVMPIALSFKLLGVGIWQARLVGVLYTFGALGLMFFLAKRLYNRAIAFGTLFVLLLMLYPPELHPLIVGRQVLGEMPSQFFLLAGYTFFYLALRRRFWWLPLGLFMWGIALVMKLQVLPFWFVSLALPLIVALLKRWWRLAVWLLIGLVGGWLATYLVGWLAGKALSGFVVSWGDPIVGLYEVTAFVPVLSMRFEAIKMAVTSGLPIGLGLAWGLWREFQNLRLSQLDSSLEVMRLMLLGLAGSWFMWFVLLGMPWPRYFATPLFFGSLFAAALLYDLTDHFNVKLTVQRAASIVKLRRITRRSAGALLAILLIFMTLPLSVLGSTATYLAGADGSARQTAEFLNASASPDALIETYDSELFFFLNRRYHYPPDQLSVDLSRRALLDKTVPIDYDPRASDPDYIVVGPFSALWRLYDPTLSDPEFRWLKTIGRYAIYQRVR
jgi:4-amino-4-deoxy-L-arabinose transferase-like glycosyltransferase